MLDILHMVVKTKDLESFQVAHFRLLSDSNYLPYGRSTLEGGT